MRRSTHRHTAAMIVATVVILAALISATRAQAQITASNSSGCSIWLTLTSGSGNSGPHLVPAGSSGITLSTPPGYAPNGVEDVNGRRRPFSTSTGCTGCIPLAQQGSDLFCCVDVCFDPGTNSITITACSPCQ